MQDSFEKMVRGLVCDVIGCLGAGPYWLSALAE